MLVKIFSRYSNEAEWSQTHAKIAGIPSMETSKNLGGSSGDPGLETRLWYNGGAFAVQGLITGCAALQKRLDLVSN